MTNKKERDDPQTHWSADDSSFEPDEVNPVPSSCPISWQPNALAPVFHGFRDYDPSSGAPAPMRVFFPSLDGSPYAAEILKGCGRYPLIIFAHGHCQGAVELFKQWYQLPAQLARAGYVVAVPHLANIGAHPSGNDTDLNTLSAVLQWMRSTWEHRDAIMPAPATGISGHSFGGVLAARLANAGGFVAYASLSGVHIDWPDSHFPILALSIPKLFIMGKPGEDSFTTLSDTMWNALSVPKHRALFKNGLHWDYLPDGQTPCHPSRGPCPHVAGATADLVTMFFARYLPPELNPNLPNSVPETLVPPALSLTAEQQFYAGSYLNGFVSLQGNPDCRIELYPSPDRVVPYVVSSPRASAEQDVLSADLVPEFTGGGGSGPPWVETQHPAGGTVVPMGSTVRMHLKNGPIP